jgi:hypothetical protein
MEPQQPQPIDPSNFVDLICVKDKGKLRIRITSPNYLHNANVQFPRDIRQENRTYRVDKQYVSLIMTRGKYFYSVKKASAVQILEDNVAFDLSNVQIFEDEDNADCVVCMASPKNIVFAPCYHFYCCVDCSARLKDCPICRVKIGNKIEKNMIG